MKLPDRTASSHPVLLAGTLALALASCATTDQTASADTLTAHVGVYSPPPAGIARLRVGVPAFAVTGMAAKREMNEVAADQATSLLVNSGRFTVIERVQLDQLLDEQGLGGIVRPGELAAQGDVEGVDFLMLGKVTNFRTKATRRERGFGLGKVALGALGVGVGDLKKEDVLIETDCGVDLRLVEPSTGRILVSDFSEYTRRDTASAIGVEVIGFSATADVDMKVSEDDYGKILRLALDDAIRKVLPRIDHELVALGGAPPAEAVPREANATAAAFCTGCGARLGSEAAFCGSCGTQVDS